MARRTNRNNKDRILEAAERLFAEKGFAGSRVDEIALEAGVNKALIYYYFDSKKDILNALFDSLFSDFTKIVTTVDERIHSFTDNEVPVTEILNSIMDLIVEKKDLLKVALIESIKADSDCSIVFKIGEVMMSTEMEKIKQSYREKGLNFSKDKVQWLVTEFFTGFLPMVTFAVFQEEMKKYFELDDETLKQNFVEAFKMTHLLYHINNRK